MSLPLDCIPCFVRNALASARHITDDCKVHEQILKEALQIAASSDLNQSAPQLSQQIHRRLRELTGATDPYRDIKKQFDALALSLLPDLRAQISEAKDPLEYAVRVVIAGNIIDLGVNVDLKEEEVKQSLHQIMTEPFAGDLDQLKTALSQAQRILYLADNAGEIIFDRLLIEQLPKHSVTVAVRGNPVLNDATLSDAYVARIDEIAELIDNGSDAPGTVWEDCCESFKNHFKKADVIIAKGQGNFETLRDSDANIFFMLKVKCSVVAAQTGYSLGTQALIHSQAKIA